MTTKKRWKTKLRLYKMSLSGRNNTHHLKGLLVNETFDGKN
ncbi:MAG: hypothetical protein JETT_3192 [Candidatus Jettenia ecosi]|uniref:Uncharacterized protein n=1 Tax=Candidatus Jettenia ecosi TaxID=2494326 RepID=A0A533Q7J5_9BACT|nr:MAG: hypothetical protein JETT_3192 [Candidatus Jettenia ecosi]